MKITFLGTGNAWGLPNELINNITDYRDYRTRTSLLIESNKKVLIDCGPDFKEQRIKHSIKNIDALLITHTHQDHTGGLDELNIYRRAYKNWQVPLYAHIDAINYLKNKKDLKYLFDSIIKEQAIKYNESLTLDNLLITPFKTNHGSFAPGSTGYIIDEDNKRLIYTSDFNSIENESIIIEKPIDSLIIETNWFNEPINNKPGHMSFQQAINYLIRWTPKNVYFTHFSDEEITNNNPLPYKTPKNHKEWDNTIRQALINCGLKKHSKQKNLISYDGLIIKI
ncbi:MAG: MBL fold metallo-hydrolase [Candidatus Nanoarchaeia archaeon]